MDIDLADLPDNVETLQRMVRTLATERANLTEARAEIERLRLIVQKLQRNQLGRVLFMGARGRFAFGRSRPRPSVRKGCLRLARSGRRHLPERPGKVACRRPSGWTRGNAPRLDPAARK